MSSTIAAPIAHVARSPWPLIACLIAGIWWQTTWGLDCDVSWLLTVAERVLDGQRLYVDVWEVNPPASVWLYLPGVLLARAAGVSPEFATSVGMIALACWSLRTFARTSGEGSAIVMPFALLLLPLGTFAQREHVALCLILPALAVLVAQSRAPEALPRSAWIAAVAAGMAVAIKPHFVLALALPAAVAMWRAGRNVVRTGEAMAAVAVVLAYAGVAIRLHPDYARDVVPVLAAVYLPMRLGIVDLLAGPVVAPVVALIVLGLVMTRRRPGVVAEIMFAAATGFALAGLVQGKGYLNHALPGIALALIGVGFALRSSAPRERIVGAAMALVIAGLELHAFSRIVPDVALRAAIARVAPARPSMVALGSNLNVGHPVVRHLGGRWVQSSPALVVSGGARYAMAGADTVQRARLRKLAARDAADFARDLAGNAPDVVLQDATLGTPWIAAHPAVARAMRAYRPAAQVSDVTVWTRRPG